MIRRREVIALLGGAGMAAWPLAAQAQQFRRVGILVSNATTDPTYIAEFVTALRKLGWTDGQNLRLDTRWYDGSPERARAFAQELTAIAPDVILTAGSPTLVAMQGASRTIPTVFLQVSDPVAQGFVSSLARPDGNITGFTAFEFSMGGKWLDLLKQMTPTLKRCLVMFGPQSPQSKFWIPSIEAAGPALGVEVTTVAVHNAAEIERAFEQVAREPNVGVVVPTDDVLNLNNELVVKLANLHRLPAIYANPQFLTHGGLMYYGYVREEQFRQAAIYVDRILKGTKPGDLPIQAPNRFQLVINLKTAKALGIEVPLGLLLRADELVE